MTLVEVTAALALLATVLVALLLASIRIRSRTAEQQRASEAMRYAEREIQRLMDSSDGIPTQADGAGDAATGLHWRIVPMDDDGPEGRRFVRFDVISTRDARPAFSCLLVATSGDRRRAP
jgi:type II secretory pathway pseudopilin PulG